MKTMLDNQLENKHKLKELRTKIRTYESMLIASKNKKMEITEETKKLAIEVIKKHKSKIIDTSTKMKQACVYTLFKDHIADELVSEAIILDNPNYDKVSKEKDSENIKVSINSVIHEDKKITTYTYTHYNELGDAKTTIISDDLRCDYVDLFCHFLQGKDKTPVKEKLIEDEFDRIIKLHLEHKDWLDKQDSTEMSRRSKEDTKEIPDDSRER